MSFVNSDDAIRAANLAVLESSIVIGQLTEEVLILRKVMSKVYNADALKKEAESERLRGATG
ncbi:hypothetical protein [Edaphobacter albus]|uniref:hypothetical protein n=1 Tax=Edaphobacter sp. 4G125 TaxID=2763071 RepID=UPI001648D2A7|nr:hypothetical protein [Edaphobacter sp. 4G125]QNI37512.1 hypothetical protein H7846_04200 [Edaphobacter sp. 4G125]